jgi:peptidoglycan/xylan/chitin deacetylase (PgdA/CDA1 family)
LIYVGDIFETNASAKEMSDIVLKPVNSRSEKPLSTRFAFGGLAGEVLQDHFNRDARQARLSTKFKLYYRLRPLIPVPLRQLLQRERTRGIDVPDCWYLPAAFVDDLQAAVERERDRVAIHPWPDGFQMAAALTHDVETKLGMDLVDKLAALEERCGLRSAWNVVPNKYKVDTGLLADLKQRGHEIGVHGYNHDGRLFESQRTFCRRTGAINQAIADFGSTGFRAPMVHRNLEWLQALDIGYDASCFDCDPFQPMAGGVGGVWPFFAGKFVELPYTLPQDHTLLVSLGETTPRIWIEKLAFLRRLAGLAMLITHPDYLNTPQRLDIYREFLEHLVEQSECWNALPHQIASWWRQRDELNIAGTTESSQLTGRSADRARLFSLSDLQLCGLAGEVSSVS